MTLRQQWQKKTVMIKNSDIDNVDDDGEILRVITIIAIYHSFHFLSLHFSSLFRLFPFLVLLHSAFFPCSLLLHLLICIFFLFPFRFLFRLPSLLFLLWSFFILSYLPSLLLSFFSFSLLPVFLFSFLVFLLFLSLLFSFFIRSPFSFPAFLLPSFCVSYFLFFIAFFYFPFLFPFFLPSFLPHFLIILLPS